MKTAAGSPLDGLPLPRPPFAQNRKESDPMHRNMRRSAALVILPVLLGGCESFLDVNQNPNAPVSARIDLTLPGVIGNFGHGVLSGSQAFWGAEWLQQFSFNNTNRAYSNFHRYEVTTLDASGAWDNMFSASMKEAKNIMTDAEKTEDWSYHGIAKFIQAWGFSIATDSWGPIPFVESFTPSIRDPKYDEQKVVYEGVQKMIDEAIADMEKQARNPGVVDLLYRGDMAKWVRLAHTIQAQLHVRLTTAPGENKTDRAQKALNELAKGLASNADDADFAYPGGNNRRPPWYAIGRGNADGTFVIDAFILGLMQQRNDPRIPIYAQPAPSDTPTLKVYRGHVSGSGGQDARQFSRIGNYFAGDSASLNWVSYAHAKFLEAEARLYVSGAAAADAPYRAAIRANMEKLRVASADIDAYLAARPALATAANPLAEIMREKYVANFLKLEVWNDWRRTGFPNVTPVASEYLTGIPQRLRTPDSEITNNGVKLAATGIPTNLEGMLVKVWWASAPR
jgi:hypothetical protein